MNPIAVQSVNLTQFGFSATFQLETSTLAFDISPYTIFTTGGAANVIGVCWEVIDPSGTILSFIDFSSPAVVPSTGIMTYSVALTSSVSQFGWYSIKGVLRDADGRDFTIVLTKNLCKPAGQLKGVVPGTLKESVDCSAPLVQVSDNTNITYLNRPPLSVTKTGMFYYPAGTLDPISFTYTPFQVAGSGNVYTGSYTVRLKTVAVFDLGDLVFVQVTYNSSLQFTVTCTSTLCQVLCCVEAMQATAQTCGSVQANNAKEKLAKATIPLLMALTLEKCGKDSAAVVKEVADILGCDCTCDGEAVEPRPIISTIEPTILDGQCATTAILVNGIWEIKTRSVTVTKAVGTPLTVTSSQTDCNVNFEVSVDEYALTGDVLNIIKNDSGYLALLNSLISQSAIDYSSIGPNCVIDVVTASYSLITDASNAAKTVSNIVIAGVVYSAPAGLSVTNAPAISNWLTSLNKGSFTVSVANNSLTIISAPTALSISTMSFMLSGGVITQQFSKNGATTFSIIKAIINYLCNLKDTQVGIGVSYSICTLQADGSVVTNQYPPGTNNSVATILLAIAQSFCTSLENIKSIAQLNCASIQALFNSTEALLQNDTLLGTRNGLCGKWSVEDMARQYLTYMSTTNQADLLTLLCQVNKRCVASVCGPVQFMSIEMIEPCPGVTNIIGTITN